jgi:alpha-amylase
MLAGSAAQDTTAWKGSAALPPSVGVGFKFIKLGIDGTPLWEEEPNRGFDTPECGQPGLTVGGQWHNAVVTCDAVTVSFEVESTTEYGENMYVVGSIPSLGDWVADNAIALSPDTYPIWTAAITIPAGQEVDYKFIKLHTDGSFAWEADPNRAFTAPTDCSADSVQGGKWQA